MNSSNQKTRRSICPLKLFFKGQTWYLWAYCIVKEDFRTFKISRIRNLVIRDEHFVREEIMNRHSNNIITEYDGRKVNLILKFNGRVLHQLYDYYDDAMMTKNEDGTYTVAVTFPENEWVYSYILSFGYNVEVIEPIYVREEIKRRLHKNLKMYR